MTSKERVDLTRRGQSGDEPDSGLAERVASLNREVAAHADYTEKAKRNPASVMKFATVVAVISAAFGGVTVVAGHGVLWPFVVAAAAGGIAGAAVWVRLRIERRGDRIEKRAAAERDELQDRLNRQQAAMPAPQRDD